MTRPRLEHIQQIEAFSDLTEKFMKDSVDDRKEAKRVNYALRILSGFLSVLSAVSGFLATKYQTTSPDDFTFYIYGAIACASMSFLLLVVQSLQKDRSEHLIEETRRNLAESQKYIYLKRQASVEIKKLANLNDKNRSFLETIENIIEIIILKYSSHGHDVRAAINEI